MIVKKISFAERIVEEYFRKRNVFKNNSKVYLGDINHTKKKFDKNIDKYIFFCAENLNNKIGILNIILKANLKIFEFLSRYLPSFILEIPLWRPYKKHFKILNRENTFFILTNNIPETLRNIFVLPLFIHRFRSHYHKLLNKKKISSIKKKKFCAFIVSNPSNIERLKFYQKLSKYKKIDSYGKIFKNADFQATDKVRHLSNPDVYKDYKFVICFENSYEEEYITEKLPNAMLGGAIPIYKGAPNVGEYFNTKSFINFKDYGSFDKMIEKIIELDNDDKKYLEFVNRAWITKRNKNNIERKEQEFTQFMDNIFKQK